MIETSLAAATQLRVLVRAVGVEGVPGVRIRRSDRGPDDFELVVESFREADDEVHESRGIRFYIDAATVRELGRVKLDLSGRQFVLEQDAPGT